MPRWHSPELREPGELVGLVSRGSSNLPLGVPKIRRVEKNGDIGFSFKKNKVFVETNF
jgi:hypothetical protein